MIPGDIVKLIFRLAALKYLALKGHMQNCLNIVSKCINLEELVIWVSNASDWVDWKVNESDMLDRLVKVFSNLSTLEIHNHQNANIASNTSIFSTLPPCTKLETLKLIDIEPDHFESIAVKFQNILNLYLDFSNFDLDPDQTLNLIRQRGQILVELKLFWEIEYNLDEVVQHLTFFAPNLRQFEFKGCEWNISRQLLVNLFSRCPKLKKISGLRDLYCNEVFKAVCNEFSVEMKFDFV